MRTASFLLGDEFGNPDAPRGSKDWAVHFAFYAKDRAHDAKSSVRHLQNALKKLKEHEAHKALGLASWDELCRLKIGITEEQAERVLAAAPDAVTATVLGKHGGDRTKADEPAEGDQADISSLPQKTLGKVGGTSAEYLTARLDRDRPDIAARVHAGEISARKGAIEAGIIRVPTKLEMVLSLLPKLAPADLDAVRGWLMEAAQ